MKLSQLNKNYILSENKLSKIPLYTPSNSKQSLLNVILDEKDTIDNIVLNYGGVVFRGFDIHSLSEFSDLASSYCTNLLEYENRSTPRTKLGGKIYTATEYPADRYIPFHNENSYTSKWPKKILFFCVVPSPSGGETPVADSRVVYKNLNTNIVRNFEEKKIMYKRNFISGVDLSWQDVFQTEKRHEVEDFCKLASIEYEWKNSLVELTIKEVCQASIKHDLTDEFVWFNQAHLFHVSALNESDQAYLIKEFGYDNLPRNSFFGDGTSLDLNDLIEIRNTYAQNKIEFKWEKGDLMIIDNLLMAHSRNPFEGYRKIAVAMGS